MTSKTLLKIGEVASAVGISVSALRYYDEIGMISAVERVGGKRRFDPDILPRLRFIQKAKEAGFALDDIRSILDDKAGGWHDLVDRKKVELTVHRNQLNSMILLLDQISRCGCRDAVSCANGPHC